jgi:hypothetical protein
MQAICIRAPGLSDSTLSRAVRRRSGAAARRNAPGGLSTFRTAAV